MMRALSRPFRPVVDPLEDEIRDLQVVPVLHQHVAIACDTLLGRRGDVDLPAGRLDARGVFMAASALGSPINWFFEGLPHDDTPARKPLANVLAMDEFLTSREGLELASLLSRVPAAQHRRLLQLIHLLVAAPEAEAEAVYSRRDT